MAYSLLDFAGAVKVFLSAHPLSVGIVLITTFLWVYLQLRRQNASDKADGESP